MDATDLLAILVPSPDEEASSSGSQVGEPSLSKIRETIKTIWVDFALLKDDVHKVRERVTTAEQRISAVKVLADHKSTASKLRDIEDRLCRNRLHFLGFLQSTEGKNSSCLSSRTPLELTPFPIYLLLRGRTTRADSQTHDGRFLYFWDKETILRKAGNYYTTIIA